MTPLESYESGELSVVHAPGDETPRLTADVAVQPSRLDRPFPVGGV